MVTSSPEANDDWENKDLKEFKISLGEKNYPKFIKHFLKIGILFIILIFTFISNVFLKIIYFIFSSSICIETKLKVNNRGWGLYSICFNEKINSY